MLGVRRARWTVGVVAGLALLASLTITAASTAQQDGGSDGQSPPTADEATRSAPSPAAPAPPERVERPAPSVTPSEKILADSVVSFPVDI